MNWGGGVAGGVRGRRRDGQTFGSHTKVLLPWEKWNESQMKLLSIVGICWNVPLALSSPSPGRCISEVSVTPHKPNNFLEPLKKGQSHPVSCLRLSLWFFSSAVHNSSEQHSGNSYQEKTWTQTFISGHVGSRLQGLDSHSRWQCFRSDHGSRVESFLWSGNGIGDIYLVTILVLYFPSLDLA